MWGKNAWSHLPALHSILVFDCNSMKFIVEIRLYVTLKVGSSYVWAVKLLRIRSTNTIKLKLFGKMEDQVRTKPDFCLPFFYPSGRVVHGEIELKAV